MIAERHQVVIINIHAEFHRTEKVGEGMALKIWAELRYPFKFILVPLNQELIIVMSLY